MQKGTKVEETIIVPEQTLIGKKAPLEYNDKFVPGAQCVAVINGVEYRGEVVDDEDTYYIFITEFGEFEYAYLEEEFQFFNFTDSPDVTAKLSVIEEVPNYDYNWAPGVKIPIPTAEDEGKVLVVTKTEGDTSIIVPEQPVPADNKTPLTNVDLTKFVVGNTVRVTVSSNSETITETGVIEEGLEETIFVAFSTNADRFDVLQVDNLLYTSAGDVFGTNATIKLEYIELNYEYQLQENSGGGSSTSNVLWPAVYEYNGDRIMATFVPEDVEPNTWCMVCGKITGNSIDTCLPVLIASYGSYTICNKTDNSFIIDDTYSVDGGRLLRLSSEGER